MAEKAEQTKYYRTQEAAERAHARALKKYYHVTLWMVDRSNWAVHSKDLRPKDLRSNPQGPYASGYLVHPGNKHFKRLADAKRTAKRLAETTYMGYVNVYDTAGKVVAAFKGDSKQNPRRNPVDGYGVAVHGMAALSKSGFPTLAAARKYVAALRVRSLLRGRSYEIISYDNQAMQSTVVESKQNAGRFSIRKTKKRLRPLVRRGTSGYDSLEQFAKRTKQVKRRNPLFGVYEVHDDTGKVIVKTKSKKAAVYIARAAGGHVTKGGTVVYSGKRAANPQAPIMFPTQAAAERYAAAHGLKNYKISKLRRA